MLSPSADGIDGGRTRPPPRPNLPERTAVGLEHLSEILACALLGVFTLIVIASVLFRYVLGSPLAWSEEATRAALIWMVMLAAGVALRRGEHVGFDLFAGMLPWRSARLLLRLMVHVLIGGLLFVLLYNGVRLVARSFSQTTPALGIEQAWLYAAIPVGAALMLVQLAALLIHDGLDLVRGAKESRT